MNDKIRNFINNNEQLIDSNDWETVYYNAQIDIVNNYDIGEFTKLILDADIDPLEHLGHIPVAYLCSTFTDKFDIPDHITSIGSFAFSNTDIKEITIPKSVQHINNKAFSECDSLEIVNIQSGLKTLHSGVFSSCYKLKQINFPTTLTDIGRSCFLGCHALPEEIYLTEGLTTIHDGAFNIGNKDNRIYFLPRSLRYIHPEAFEYGSKLVVHEKSYAHNYALEMHDRYEVEVIL